MPLVLLQISLKEAGETYFTIDPNVVDLAASAKTALPLPIDACDDAGSMVDMPALQLQ